jgi:hypothetical protein
MEIRQPRNKQQAQCGLERSRRARRLRATPARPQANRGAGGGAAAPIQPPAEISAKAPMRCAFGATRAGSLLGRLRLHLQTERFLAVRRGDAIWEAGCIAASVALGDMVAALSESEMQAPLPRQEQPVIRENAPCGTSRGSAPSGASRGDAPGNAVQSTAPPSGGAR